MHTEEKMTNGGRRMRACLVAALLMLGMVLGALMPAAALAEEDVTREQGKSVYRLVWNYKGVKYHHGACFLINDQYVATSWYCCMFSQDELKDQNLSVPDVDVMPQDFYYTVAIRADDEMPAVLVDYNVKENWAILKLEKPIEGATGLPIRDSQTVAVGEDVYCVGQANSPDVRLLSSYNVNQVVSNAGKVIEAEGDYRANRHDASWEFEGRYLATTCEVLYGGPIVDSSGKVIGIGTGGVDTQYNCVASSSLIGAINKNGISAEVDEKPGLEGPIASLQTTIDEAEDELKDADKHTKEAVSAVEDALEEAKPLVSLTIENPADEVELADKTAKIKAANTKLNDALKDYDTALVEGEDGSGDTSEPKKGLSGMQIAAIICGSIAALGLIAGLTIVLVRRSKRKKAAAVAAAAAIAAQEAAQAQQAAAQQAAAQAQQAAAQQAAAAAAAPAAAAPAQPRSNASIQTVNGGSLTRKRTNETFRITLSEFTVGRERTAVDYCIEGNSNIGRVHARFIVRNGQTFVVDNSSTNGTYVNGTKIRPGVEQQLQSGDIVRLADEKFRFTT